MLVSTNSLTAPPPLSPLVTKSCTCMQNWLTKVIIPDFICHSFTCTYHVFILIAIASIWLLCHWVAVLGDELERAQERPTRCIVHTRHAILITVFSRISTPPPPQIPPEDACKKRKGLRIPLNLHEYLWI